MNIIAVKKERLARCNYSLTVIKQRQEVWKDELSGDAREAASQAVRLAAKNHPAMIMGCGEVMQHIPREFGGMIE